MAEALSAKVEHVETNAVHFLERQHVLALLGVEHADDDRAIELLDFRVRQLGQAGRDALNRRAADQARLTAFAVRFLLEVPVDPLFGTLTTSLCAVSSHWPFG